MKNKLLLTSLLLITSLFTKAQFVTIPDANFVTFLQTYYPTCMNGNQMDTTCIDITSATSIGLSFQNITDLTGVEYFSSLTSLDCYNNQLTSLPRLPSNLQNLHCGSNQLTSLPTLPTSLLYLDCGNNLLNSLSSLPPNLQWLICSSNQLSSLPSLPTNNFIYLHCDYNQLTSLPNLPASLLNLNCENNQLSSLPNLPNNLNLIYCSHNQLSVLPTLPSNINTFNCDFNQLTSLPILPNSLQYLSCAFNSLTTLPNLPTNLQELDCSFNNIVCFPVFPNSLNNTVFFFITNNPFTCLPNYLNSMDNATLAYPLCVNGDTISNLTGCASAEGIVGYTFKDNNSNCIKDNGDLGINNIPLKLYDINNNLLSQTISFSNGIYNFPDSLGTYIVRTDTISKPYVVQCNNPGIDSTITLSPVIPLASDVNFDIACKPGFDIGVQSIVRSGWVFPGQQHQIKVMAGDMSHWYNLNCAAGVSGQVQIIVTGNVTYNGIALGALTPSVVGNVFTYTIADFGAIINATDFGLMFTTDTTAQVGDSICVDINVTPLTGDNYTSNNTYHYCYQVVNSYDPNMKEVYPVNVLPGFQDWFTYTIHFQNTGSAPAFNIRLADTLSNNLDLETFEVINYSHYNNVTLTNNILTFRFPNIMLPDSTSDLEGSKGFVQYRIKPKTNLPLGTQIRNTAYIYFDYNAPIITNTTINEFVQPVSIGTEISNLNNPLYVYPNPATGIFNFKTKQLEDLKINSFEVFDLLGQKVLDATNITISSSSNFQIDLSNQPNGVYFVKVNGLNKSFSKKLIKQ